MVWVGRRRRQTRHLRWEKSALKVTDSTAVRSVTSKPLAFWVQLDATDIKVHVSLSKGKRQVVCQHVFFLSIQRAIRKHLEASDFK